MKNIFFSVFTTILFILDDTYIIKKRTEKILLIKIIFNKTMKSIV